MCVEFNPWQRVCTAVGLGVAAAKRGTPCSNITPGQAPISASTSMDERYFRGRVVEKPAFCWNTHTESRKSTY